MLLGQQHMLQKHLNLLGQSKQGGVTQHWPRSSLPNSICVFLPCNRIRNCDRLLLLKIYQMAVWGLFIITTSVGYSRLLCHRDALQVILYVEVRLFESVK